MRFYMKEHGEIVTTPLYSDDRYFSIEDKLAYKFGMPTKAVSIYFGTKYRCLEVIKLMNDEWQDFVRDPK